MSLHPGWPAPARGPLARIVEGLALALVVGSCAGPTPTLTPATPEPPSAIPGITFTAELASLRAGECTTLHWQVSGSAFSVVLDGQSVSSAGEQTVCPAETHLYELIADRGTAADRATVEITVDATRTPSVAPSMAPTVEPGSSAYLADAWTPSSGPPGGLGYDIRMDPRDPDVLYATDAYAGAFKSVDGGQRWQAVNEGITARTGPAGDSIPVFSLTIDPNEPDRVWVGTQYGRGAFVSEDAGASWTEKSEGLVEPSLTIRGFAVEPGNSDVVYLAGELSSWDWNGSPLPGLGLDMTKGVVYRTSNGGRSWERIWQGDNLARYVWIDPRRPSRLFVSTGIFDREAANSDPTTLDPGGLGVLRSDDGGRSWETLGEANGFRADELYVGSLFMNPADPDVLLAATANDNYQGALGHSIGAIYRTSDGGDSWSRVLDLSNASAVEMCTGNPSVAYAGSRNGIFRSSDGGLTWEPRMPELWGSEDLVAGFPIDMQCDPRDANRLFINNYIGGNFLTSDGGQTWTVTSAGYTGALLRQVAVASTDPALVYAASRMGISVTVDAGSTWHGTSRGVARRPEAIVAAVDPADSRHLLAVLDDAGPEPLETRDGGMTWRIAPTGLGSELGGPGAESISRIAFSPRQPGMLMATIGKVDCWQAPPYDCSPAGRGVIRSADGGASWSTTQLETGQALDVDLARSAPVAYAAVYPDRVYRSADNGATWTLVAEGLAGNTANPAAERMPVLTALAIDPVDPDLVYAGFDRGGMMVSRDGGRSWTIMASAMAPEASISDIEADPAHPGVVYASARDSGVQYSTDGGVAWILANRGLSTRAVVDLAVAGDGSVLYAATLGGGVLRLGTPTGG